MNKQIKDFNELISNSADYLESQLSYSIRTVANLVEIRDILGHVSIQTTEIYARADSKQKRQAIEKAYVNVNPDEEPMWTKDENLVSWLKKF